MKMLLMSSSRFLKNDLKPYLGKSLSELRIAHIINGSKGKGVNDLGYIERTKEIFKDNNCYFEDLDLDGKDEKYLREYLKNFNAVFVNGGSTFYLLKSVRESGFDKVIKELLGQDFIYMGASAGSYVCCPTIEMALWKHQDKYDHCGINDLSALNLVPFLITVHYSEEYKELLKEKISKTNYSVKILNDDQAILINENNALILGGEEILLYAKTIY